MSATTSLPVDEDFDLRSFEQYSNPELTALYLNTRISFYELVNRTERISRGSGGIIANDNRTYYASLLFTRVCVTAKSIEKLLPFTKVGELWDFSSTASLVRNLVEACLVYHWLCRDGLTEDVRQGRFILLYLHDYGSRRRLFPDQEPVGEAAYEDLVRRFDDNPYLATLEARQRGMFLRGERTPFVQDDVLAEMGADATSFRFLYRFFSQHTHTGPLSFYRMHEQGRGTGVENRVDKIYTLTAIDFARDFLLRTVDEHLLIFPDAETRAPFLTRQQIERNVEEEQGRRRPSRARRAL